MGPQDISVAEIVALRNAGRAIDLALLDRNESGLRRLDADWNMAFYNELAPKCDLAPKIDRLFGSCGRLRVWEILGCRSENALQ
jgi:hypothetical protein